MIKLSRFCESEGLEVISALPCGEELVFKLKATDEKEEFDIDKKLAEVCNGLGFTSNLYGTAYIKEAVKASIKYGGGKVKLCEIYKAVAEKYLTTEERVERSIRHAVKVVWERAKTENVNRILGRSIFDKNFRPKSGELIGLISDRIIYY